jgi:putative membrane protein
MRNVIRRGSVVLGAGGLSLATAGVLAPGALAADTIDGDVTVTNTETVQVLMSASGKIDAQRVYEQLVLRGDGKVDIANPVSSKGLRNLDGFGGFDVQDGKQRVKTDVDGTKKYRSVSDYTKKLPIDIDITYTFDGKKVDPGDIVGKSGDLKVRYVVTNTTGKTEDVAYQDGNGRQKSSTEEVVVPMVGSLTTVLPSTFTKVTSAEANAAGDGRGGTQLSFTMTLIPPIGKATAEFGYEARVTDGVIPKASVSVLPVNPLESPSFKGGAESYKGGADTGQDLTAGATEIDANVLKLRDGANDLVTGILQLSDGANQLSAGTKELKEGTGELSGGAGDLNEGASKISAGLEKIREGVNASGSSPGLVAGTEQLVGGLDQIDASLATFKEGIANGTPQNGGKGLDNAIIPGVRNAISELTKVGATPEDFGGLQALAYVRDSLLEPLITSLAGDPRLALAQGASDLVDGVHGKLSGPSGVGGLQNLQTGLETLSATIAGTIGNKTDGRTESLRGGLAAARTGADGLRDNAPSLVGGVNDLSDGATKLKSGTEDLVWGANQLDSGAGQLSDGSGELAAGLGEAAESAPDLPEGASRLSKEGTSVLAEKGNATAMDYGLKYALIEAGAARAATAQPYGSPAGAMALTAYKFEIAGENGADSANLKRGIAALVLMAGAGIFATVRRRGLI